jgi:hypothetical protein
MHSDAISRYADDNGIERGESFDVITKALAFLSAAGSIVFGVEINNEIFTAIIA